ncbi:hypothetical protein QBC47DRAFT_379831 [Echria macrotheca]|uniref:Uncharacterized protein n=1 Tax=Echria macrotheca TaxID=438768 RepID=A0AAJ0BID0_9PEZI|nr:hypothetical protein QBC47DRAFT_379831 [Echria macrotheca]
MDADALIRTLRAYDAAVDATAVKAAFDSEDSHAVAAWVARHLAPDTLLSIDELNQFNALEKAGVVDKLASSTDLAAAHPLGETEIRDAIDELRRSTEAINKQTEALRQQHEALDRLVNAGQKDRDARADLDLAQLQKWDAKRKSAVLAVEELSQRLDSRIAELEQQTTAGRDVQETANALFHSDDRLLSSLQKLGWELETEDPEEQDNVVMLRETCARLIKFMVEGLRARLDRIYLEALNSSMRSGATRRVSPAEVSGLQEELESLYAEILPVAQMSVEQQFLEPALKTLADKHGKGLARSEEAVSYLHDCLDYLLDRTQETSRRVELIQAYQVAAAAMTEVARSELAVQVDLPAKRERSATAASPARRRKSSGQGNAVSPVRARGQPGRRRSSGVGAIGDEPPLDEILRNLAISLPQEESGSNDAHAQALTLASTLAERRHKADDVARNAQESFESATMKQMADAKLAIQLVRDSVLAESPWGEVRLVDPEIDESIAVLSQEMDDVRAKVDKTEAELVKVRGRSVKRDELIERWGSR